jgi:tetratricopeptide (TPR) repeat protein
MAAEVAWYNDGATVVAAVALGVSLVSSLISMWHTRSQDMQSAHLDLRAVLQRLLALPKETMDLQQKYKDDPNSLLSVNELSRQEMTFLASQGAGAVRKLGDKRVSSAEYLTIGTAQAAVFDFKSQEEFLQKACETAHSANDELAALRLLANAMFSQQRVEEARADLQKALNIFSKYSGYDPATVAVANAITHIQWAGLEAGIGNIEGAQQHLAPVEAVMASLPPSPVTKMLNDLIKKVRGGGDAGQAAGGAAPALV